MSGKLYQHTLVPTANGGYLNGTIQTGDLVLRNEANSVRMKEMKIIGERRSLTSDNALQRVLVSVGERSSTFNPIDWTRANRLVMGSGGCVGLRLDSVMYRMKLETYGILLCQGFVFFYQPSGDRIWCDDREDTIDDGDSGGPTDPIPPDVISDVDDIPFVCGAYVAQDATLHIAWTAVEHASAYVLRVYSGLSCAGDPVVDIQLTSDQLAYNLDVSLFAVGDYSFNVEAIGDGVRTNNVTSTCCAFNVCPTIDATSDISSPVIWDDVVAFTISPSGGAAPYTFAVVDGMLPEGLTLNTTTGEITGKARPDCITSNDGGGVTSAKFTNGTARDCTNLTAEFSFRLYCEPDENEEVDLVEFKSKGAASEATNLLHLKAMWDGVNKVNIYAHVIDNTGNEVETALEPAFAKDIIGVYDGTTSVVSLQIASGVASLYFNGVKLGDISGDVLGTIKLGYENSIAIQTGTEDDAAYIKCKGIRILDSLVYTKSPPYIDAQYLNASSDGGAWCFYGCCEDTDNVDKLMDSAGTRHMTLTGGTFNFYSWDLNTETSSFPFTVRCTDANGCLGDTDFIIAVQGATSYPCIASSVVCGNVVAVRSTYMVSIPEITVPPIMQPDPSAQNGIYIPAQTLPVPEADLAGRPTSYKWYDTFHLAGCKLISQWTGEYLDPDQWYVTGRIYIPTVSPWLASCTWLFAINGTNFPTFSQSMLILGWTKNTGKTPLGVYTFTLPAYISTASGLANVVVS